MPGLPCTRPDTLLAASARPGYPPGRVRPPRIPSWPRPPAPDTLLAASARPDTLLAASARPDTLAGPPHPIGITSHASEPANGPHAKVPGLL